MNIGLAIYPTLQLTELLYILSFILATALFVFHSLVLGTPAFLWIGICFFVNLKTLHCEARHEVNQDQGTRQVGGAVSREAGARRQPM